MGSFASGRPDAIVAWSRSRDSDARPAESNATARRRAIIGARGLSVCARASAFAASFHCSSSS